MEVISGDSGPLADGEFKKGTRASTKLGARLRDAFFKEMERFLKENPEHLQGLMHADSDFLLGFMGMCMKQTPKPPLEVFQQISGRIDQHRQIEVIFRNKVEGLMAPKAIEIPPIEIVESKDSPGNLFAEGGPDPMAIAHGFPEDVRRLKDVRILEKPVDKPGKP